jgi:DNA-binding NarL/FixJ family response regulator
VNAAIRVLIASDSQLSAECLSLGLSTAPHVSVVAVTGEEEVVAKTMEHLPDILLVHFPSEWPTALRLAGDVTAGVPECKVILVGVPSGESEIIACIEAGARGWLPQSVSLEDLKVVIQKVNEGEIVCSPRVAHSMFRRLSELAANSPVTEGFGSSALTARELQIMELLAEEKSNQQIAADLHLSVPTVKKYVHNILEKMQLSSRAQLAIQSTPLDEV